MAAARAAGLSVGVLMDAVLADPSRGHPVAGFGRAAGTLERRLYADSRLRGVGFVAACTGLPLVASCVVEHGAARRPVLQAVTTAAATWAVLGGTSLAREGEHMAGLLGASDLDGARLRLRNLCARDAAGLDAGELARASVESLAENASDALVAPLLWGAVAGVPGLVVYRAANTLDAMVGYRSARYLRFGWAAARFDDALNLLPARVTAVLAAVCAPVVGGSPQRAWRVMRRDGGAHPSPNAGRPEAAVAGALGVHLGGRNVYPGHVEDRPGLGDGPGPGVGDVRRAALLVRAVSVVATALAVGIVLVLPPARRLIHAGLIHAGLIHIPPIQTRPRGSARDRLPEGRPPPGAEAGPLGRLQRPARPPPPPERRAAAGLRGDASWRTCRRTSGTP